MAKMKVHELAKELEIQSKEVLAFFLPVFLVQL